MNVTEGRKVKGELCLHKVCDLYSLLKPWIAAFMTESTKAKVSEKKKHLVIIINGCRYFWDYLRFSVKTGIEFIRHIAFLGYSIAALQSRTAGCQNIYS